MAQIVLTSDDGTEFHVTKDEMGCSGYLSSIIDDLSVIPEIPIPKIPDKILRLIHIYMKRSVRPSNDKWVLNFVKENIKYIGELLEAANFLEIDELVETITDLLAKEISMCRSIEELREKFNIENDFSIGEENAVKEQVLWALTTLSPTPY